MIVYNAGIKEEASIHISTNSSSSFAHIEHPETLIVDLIDAKHDRLIWRGVATNTLVQDHLKAEKKAETATRKMFAHFPPKSSQ